MRRMMITLLALSSLALLGAANASIAAAASPAIHIVRPGQTLYSIASSYGLSTWAIARANGVWNPNMIYTGQVLIIPSAGVNPIFPAYPRENYAPHTTFGCVYHVQYGDTIYSIASRYRNDAWTIARANGILNLNWIFAGQLLRIPGCN
jgi:LysM repeat protein